MIKTENLYKLFLTEEVETTALNSINLSIFRGDFAAIMGPSGCGKSTLLNILGMLDSPTKGSYTFNGINVSKFNEVQQTKVRKGSIGFIFQNFNLIDNLTVYENVELPLKFLKHPNESRKQLVTAVLERMGMTHRSKHFPSQLSGGQQQRVAVSRAIVTKPSLILADEPTGNLDSQNGKEVMSILKELNKDGTTIVMVTHSQKHAEAANYIIKLLDGRIISD